MTPEFFLNRKWEKNINIIITRERKFLTILRAFYTIQSGPFN